MGFVPTVTGGTTETNKKKEKPLWEGKHKAGRCSIWGKFRVNWREEGLLRRVEGFSSPVEVVEG